MTDTDPEGASEAPPSEPTAPSWKKTLALSAGIAAIGAAALVTVYYTQPGVARDSSTTERTPALVDVTTAEGGRFRPTIVATGTVEPVRDVKLRTQVGGKVSRVADAFVPGGRVSEGDLLVRLDPTEQRYALRQRKSELVEARAELRKELGRQKAARKDYRLSDQQLSGEDKALALHEPQVEAARSRVMKARTAVEQAELELARTRLTAPFDAQVIQREVSVGSRVAAGDSLGRLVGTEAYWVELAVPVSQVGWLAFPEANGGRGSRVRLHDPGAWPQGAMREARLFKRVGILDESSRMVRALARVTDPLAQADVRAGKPKLTIGAYVRAQITGRAISDVVRVARDHVRRRNTVWVMDDGKLSIRNVTIAMRDERYAYIRNGLRDGERLVTNDLASIREGMPLRTQDAEGATDANAQTGNGGSARAGASGDDQ